MSFAPALAQNQLPATASATRPQVEFVGADSAKIAAIVATVIRLLRSGTTTPALVGALLDPTQYNGNTQLDVVPDSTSQTPTTFHVGDRNAAGLAATDYGFILFANGTFSGIQAVIASVRSTIWFGGAFINKVKAGVPVDADFPAVQAGMCVLDTTNNKIWFRNNVGWISAQLA